MIMKPLAMHSIQPSHTANHRYVGEYLDEDSGFYHLRARDYDPKIGLFIKRDTINGLITNPIALNNYVYSGSNPIDYTDPAGEMIGIAGIIDIGLSMNFQGMTRVGNVQGARIVIKLACICPTSIKFRLSRRSCFRLYG